MNSIFLLFPGEDLRKLFDGVDENDREKIQDAMNALNATDNSRGRRGIVVQVKNIDTCPQLALLRYGDDYQLKYGVYIFVRPAITLVRYMNKRFNFSGSTCLNFAMRASVPIEKYKDDNFF